MQRAGDIMYVPSMWAHMVVNTRPSIGAALEFDTGYWLYWVNEVLLSDAPLTWAAAADDDDNTGSFTKP